MENNNIFAGMPVLTLITNFSQTGNFERIHLVMERKLSGQSQNQSRKKAIPNINRFWNGPDFEQTIDRN
jgi:hypothetical protein